MKKAKILPLHRNESYWLLEEDFLARCSLSQEAVAQYPDVEQLQQSIGSRLGVAAEGVVIAAGSDAIIEAIVRYCVRLGLKALLPVPTFYRYERIAKRAGLALSYAHYLKDEGAFVFPTDEIVAALNSGEIGALFLCQPNNPLGSLIPPADFELLLRVAAEKNVLVLVDEAYAEFDNPTALGAIGQQRIIIVRTFSKSFGLAGIRVGYALTETALATELRSQLLPWPVAHVSLVVAQYAFGEPDYFARRRTVLMKERDAFATHLKEIPGVTVYPSRANFLLIAVPDAPGVVRRLAEKDILVANGEDLSFEAEAKETLAGTLRLAVPAPEDRHRVLEALRAGIV